MHKYFWPAIIGLTAWMGVGSYFLACDDCNKSAVVPVTNTETIAAPPVKVAKELPSVFNIADGTRFTTGSSEHYTFGRAGFDPNITDPTKAAFTKVAEYMKNNPNRLLMLTGRYTSAEQSTYSGDAANLGIARANSIKEYLVGKGVDGERVSTNGFEEYILNYNSNDRLPEGVLFRFNGSDELDGLGDRLRATPLNAQFDSGSDNISLNSTLKNYFADLKFYTDKVPDAKVSVTGHTDSDGRRSGNVALGLRRAKLIKDFMIKQGINPSVITKPTSQGPDAPIADNNTDEGKAANRRVEIRVIN